MCSHYQAEKRRHFYEKRFGIKLPPDWEPPRGTGGLHVYPTQFAPIIHRPPERNSDDEAVPDFEVVAIEQAAAALGRRLNGSYWTLRTSASGPKRLYAVPQSGRPCLGKGYGQRAGAPESSDISVCQ